MNGSIRIRKHTVTIGRIHAPRWDRSHLERNLVDLVSSGKMYKQDWGKGKNKFTWAFGDYLINEDEGEKIIFARLGKIKSDSIEDFYDKETKSFRQMVIESKTISYSNFIIIPEDQVIVFEEQPSITAKMFLECLSRFYRRHSNGISTITIDLIVDEEKIFTRLDSFDKITKVSFKVIPSNPDDEDDFRKLDEELKESNATEAGQWYKNESEGLLIENSMIKQGLALCNAGYGDYTVVGETNDTEHSTIMKIDSKDHIWREKVDLVDEPIQLIKSFLDVFRHLSRFKRKSD